MTLRIGRRPQTTRFCMPVCLALLVAAGAARAEAQTKAYVAHRGANVVSVIDTATGTVVRTVAVGAAPTRVAIARDGSRAYVTNGESDSVSVIDTLSDMVIDTLIVGDNPSYLAVTPDGGSLYVMTGSGAVDVVDIAQRTVTATIPVGASGDIAITPDGTRAYVAAGLVYVIDTSTNTVVRSFEAATASIEGISNNATTVTLSPDGTRAYVGVTIFNTLVFAGFSGGGSIALVDTGSEAVTGVINLFSSLPGTIALTPDGSRAYVGIQSTFVNTGYGMGFLPGRHAYVVDLTTETIPAVIDLGGAGYTPSGIGVTADRRAVYIAVPTLNKVAIADVNTNLVTSLLPVVASPGHLAIVPDGTVALVPYLINAADDSATVTTVGGTAVANVLANDRLGGLMVTGAHVTLNQQSSSSAGVALDPATGALNVAPGTVVGTYALVYRICEIASPSNCDNGTVTVTVRTPFVIDAVNDSATTLPGRLALANVLANDTLDGTLATTARVTLSVVSSTNPNVQMNVSTGQVYVWVGTPPGAQTLKYRICEIASPTNCDDAHVAITVVPFAIDAVNDTGSAPRSGGTAVANVLANDTFAGALATLAKVRLSQVSSSHAGIALNIATGAVSVAGATPVGTYTLGYRICEIATPSNCDAAIVSVSVTPLQITAVNDYARGSSKVANTALASVLANDWLGTTRATTANVKVGFVSLTPVNSKIRLDVTDGSVDVLGKTDSGLYALVYEICEIAMPTNCGRATVQIDLSGR